MYIKRFLLTKWALYAIFFILLGILFFNPINQNTRPVHAATAAVDCTNTTITEISQLECEALVALYNNTDGPNWTNNTGWLDDTIKPCRWYGVTCSGSNITELDLSGESSSVPFGLQGDLPSEIGNLNSLTKLKLSFNQLSRLPDTIDQLTNLASLNLYSNQLSSLPVTIRNLNSLTWLDLSFNQFSSLPDEIGSLSNLTDLFLRFNQLSDLPATIEQLTNLRTLNLQGNPLEWDNLSAEIWNLTSLTSLTLYRTSLGTLPPEIENLTNLTHLDLSVNGLTSLPDELWTLTNLIGLGLKENQLISLPPQIGNLTNLIGLGVFGNELTSLPKEIGQLTKLRQMELSRNRLITLPIEIGNLTELTALYLHSNQLSTLPIQYTNLISLTHSILAYNRLVITDPTLRAFVTSLDPDWEKTQTVAPLGVTAIATGTESVELTWTPISFQDHGGFYEISVSDGITFTVHGTTTSKSDSGYVIDGLTSIMTDNIRIRTYTPYHNGDPDEAWDNFTKAIWSNYSDATPITESHEIQGSVWSDANADGIRDAGESGRAGVIVKIQSYPDCSISMITTTDANGNYTFSGLDPSLNYFVSFKAPDDTIFSPQNVGGDDTIDSDVHPNTGQINFEDIPIDNVDVGIIDQPDSDTGGITGTVYRDYNGDEIGICGVTVKLQDLDSNDLATTLTDVDGGYAFIDLDPGTYKAQFIEPEDAIFSLDNSLIDPQTGSTGPIDITAGKIKILSVSVVPDIINGDTLDCTGKGKGEIIGFIKGRLWNDTNRNGLNDDNSYEPGVTVVCKCADEFGKKVEVETDESGYYQIAIYRVTEKYIIGMQPPHNKILTKSGNDDSTLDPISGITGPIHLNGNNNYSTEIDVGLLMLGDVNCDGKSDNKDKELFRLYDSGLLRDSAQCPSEGGEIHLSACGVNGDDKCTERMIGPPSGDVNCDGKTDSIDVLFILQYDVDSRERSYQCPPESDKLYLPACDVSGDGKCNTIDALFILQCDIGIVSPFCPAARIFDNEENTEDQTLLVTDSIVQQNSAILRMIHPEQVSNGETFTVIIEAESEAKIGAVTASMGYDTTQFEFVDCQDLKDNGIPFGVCNLSKKDGEGNRVIFNAIMPEGVSGSLTLAEITFKYISTKTNIDGIDLKVHTFVDKGGNPLPVTIIPRNSHQLHLPIIIH